MKNQENMTSSKGHNNPLVTELKDMGICDLINKEFKTAVLRKLDELQVNRKVTQGNKYTNKMRDKAKR